MGSTDIVDPLASVRLYLQAEKSDSTRRAYTTDFADFQAWCDRTGESALPASPIGVAKYLAQLADGGSKTATIERRVASIRYIHKAAGHDRRQRRRLLRPLAARRFCHDVA